MVMEIIIMDVIRTNTMVMVITTTIIVIKTIIKTTTNAIGKMVTRFVTNSL